MIKESIKLYLEDYHSKADIIKVWYIKEYLQTLMLKQIYEYEAAKNLIFYGWTSIRFLFGLNRLSEDLDFIWQDFEDYQWLAEHIQKFFHSHNIQINTKIQKFRIILNFKDFLNDFDLSFGNSKDLYIKIEISDHFDFCKNYNIQLYPIFKLNQSLVIKSLDKASLFATKINAVLYRNWEKQIWTDKITVKWRDIYDLFWYLSNWFEPNIDCIDWISSKQDLKEKLDYTIKNIDFDEVVLDIENFVEDKSIIDFMKDNWKDYILENISNL